MSSYSKRRTGLITPPDELAEKVRILVQRLGPKAAAQQINVGRETCCAFGCGAAVSRGTLSLIEQGIEGAIESLPQSEDEAEATVQAQ